MKKKQRYVSELEDDIAEFNTLMNTYENKLNECYEKKIKVKNSDLLKFLEDEITGRSKVYKNMDLAIDAIKDMEKDVAQVEREIDILGADVLQKKMNIFKRMGTKFSNFVHKWAGKIIGSIVFFCNVL